MAKWGEGDPRWIVEERPDATNPSNWHWTEKNAFPWSKRKLTDLLVDLRFAKDNVGSARITEVESITGEASANNRKAKLIFFYELVLKLKWKGTASDGSDCSGTIHIPNLSEENDMDEIEVQVALKSDETPARRAVKELIRKDGEALVHEQLGKWLTALKVEFTSGMVLPTKKTAVAKDPGGAATPTAAPVPTGVKLSADGSVAKPKAAAAASSSTGGAAGTRDLTVTDKFGCSPMDWFSAYLDEKRVQAFTQSSAKIDAKVGGGFEMFGGNVHGTFKELVPGERIRQAWRFSHWPDGHYSEVTISIKDLNGATVTVTQTKVPYEDYERTLSGWKELQFARMKAILGLGGGPATFCM